MKQRSHVEVMYDHLRKDFPNEEPTVELKLIWQKGYSKGWDVGFKECMKIYKSAYEAFGKVTEANEV